MINEPNISPELAAAIAESKKKEQQFFERHGFPDFQITNESGEAHTSYTTWLEFLKLETKFHQAAGSIFGTPMARRMFMLGFLTAQKGQKEEMKK